MRARAQVAERASNSQRICEREAGLGVDTVPRYPHPPSKNTQCLVRFSRHRSGQALDPYLVSPIFLFFAVAVCREARRLPCGLAARPKILQGAEEVLHCAAEGLCLIGEPRRRALHARGVFAPATGHFTDTLDTVRNLARALCHCSGAGESGVGAPTVPGGTVLPDGAGVALYAPACTPSHV